MARQWHADLGGTTSLGQASSELVLFIS